LIVKARNTLDVNILKKFSVARMLNEYLREDLVIELVSFPIDNFLPSDLVPDLGSVLVKVNEDDERSTKSGRGKEEQTAL
jgi:hypothetical protein